MVIEFHSPKHSQQCDLCRNCNRNMGRSTRTLFSRNDSRIYQIKRDIVEHGQGQQLISVYYTKLKAFWDELSSYHEVLSYSCGGLQKLKEMDEKEKVM